MDSWTGWSTDRKLAAHVLTQAHGARQKEGRQAGKEIRHEVQRLKASGDTARAAMLEERETKKSRAFARRLRRREEEDAKRDGQKLRAAIKKSERLRLKASCPAKLYRHFEYGKGGVGTSPHAGAMPRDLFFEWIPRGFSSGKDRQFRKEQKRSNARTARWKSGEFGRKLRYIERADALEQVEGNIISSMGDHLEERVACSRQIEQLEALDRDNAGVYRHVIIALPHELEPEARARLLASLVKPLESMGLPFTAALHKPDEQGDQRNFHAHILVNLRPMTRVGDHEWTFAAFKRRSLETPAGLKLQRRFIARSFNRALAAERSSARYTHLSRGDRGQASPGNTKKFESEVRLERKNEMADGGLRSAQGHSGLLETVSHEVDETERQLNTLADADGQLAAITNALSAKAAVENDANQRAMDRLAKADATAVRMTQKIAAAERSREHTEAVEKIESQNYAASEPSQTVENSSMAEAVRARELMDEDRRRRQQKPLVRRIDNTSFSDWFDAAQPLRLGERRQASHDAAMELELSGKGALLHTQAFQVVRDAFISPVPKYFVERQEDGARLVYAEDDGLVRAYQQLSSDDASAPFLLALLNKSPAPPTDLDASFRRFVVGRARPAKARGKAVSAAARPVEATEEGPSLVEQLYMSGRFKGGPSL
ncbi:MobA/MobL family protein [Sphingobium sp. SJ10-10]|uniref:MobA/MobL family protein n=1 Tax=Sphingobium sp. SJ10-10 TaxID=3114999 RepID=UPI002E1754FF|nr:MobA/MobL family protein [Sphingobium sp. SJ10-10]